jgi:hypothetical protein
MDTIYDFTPHSYRVSDNKGNHKFDLQLRHEIFGSEFNFLEVQVLPGSGPGEHFVLSSGGYIHTSGPWKVGMDKHFNLYYNGRCVLSFKKPVIPEHQLSFSFNTYLYDPMHDIYDFVPRTDLTHGYRDELKFNCELDAGTFFFVIGAMKKDETSPTGYAPFRISCNRTPQASDYGDAIETVYKGKRPKTFSFDPECKYARQTVVFSKPVPLTLCVDKVTVLEIREPPKLIRCIHWSSDFQAERF